MKRGASEGQVRAVLAQVSAPGVVVYRGRSASRTVIAALGEGKIPAAEDLARAPGVESVAPLSGPYKLASRAYQAEDSVVRVCGVPIGGRHVCVIAGPCAVEGSEMLRRIARHCKEHGATVLRGGAYKPRTSPYSFQGLGPDGLAMLRDCGDELAMPVCTEVTDPRDVELVARYADMLQVGARNMQNFTLLREVGQARKPVLLKRGLAATVQDLLMSAEYVLAEGNPDVVLCERGIKTFETAVRYTLDVACVPVVRRDSHLPIVVDPSHAAGRRDLVTALAWAGIAAGAAGLIVEVHDQPEAALCDGPQALRPADFARLMRGAQKLSRALGGRLVRGPQREAPAATELVCEMAE
jgi:3-deoxy-7-phosphoheptulonate synthase